MEAVWNPNIFSLIARTVALLQKRQTKQVQHFDHADIQQSYKQEKYQLLLKYPSAILELDITFQWSEHHHLERDSKNLDILSFLKCQLRIFDQNKGGRMDNMDLGGLDYLLQALLFSYNETRRCELTEIQ